MINRRSDKDPLMGYFVERGSKLIDKRMIMITLTRELVIQRKKIEEEISRLQNHLSLSVLARNYPCFAYR